jgi:hypothetical protein
VVDGEAKHECCFEASIKDTEQPLHGKGNYRTVAECVDRETAVAVCRALNDRRGPSVLDAFFMLCIMVGSTAFCILIIKLLLVW